MDTATKVKIRRAIAAIVGTVALLIFVITYFAFPEANRKLGEILVVAALVGYGYAAFPGLHPGQARWDALDEEIAAKSRQDPVDARHPGKRDG